MRAFARRHWIPPAALLYAQLAHGLSWAIVLFAAWNDDIRSAMFGFAWIHAVALGWVTMAALAILLHALPAFTDVEWRGQTIARWSLVLYGIGVALLIYGFIYDTHVLGAAGIALLVALAVYLSTAFATAGGAMRSPDRVDRAVARAFAMTFAFLAVTALIGSGLAWMLGGHAAFAWIAALPAAHADLGTLGWLSLLIFGVSMRTLRPITGVATRMRWMHIASGSGMVLGVPLLAAGAASGIRVLLFAGGALVALASLGYVSDVLDVVRRATNRHRPPQAFVVAANLWFSFALVLGGGVILGRPWQAAYIYVLLAGWVGQMVNAHLYHIGVRVLSTVYRGEDDETRPQELLDPRLSWLSWIAFQTAVAAIAVALLDGKSGMAMRGAVFGAVGWIAMVANILVARTRAKFGVARTF